MASGDAEARRGAAGPRVAHVDVRFGAPTAAKDRAMADIFIGYLSAFAKTGDPSRDGLPPWPRYDAANAS